MPFSFGSCPCWQEDESHIPSRVSWLVLTIATTPARIGWGSSGQMATTLANVDFNQHPTRKMKTTRPLPLHVPEERGSSRYRQICRLSNLSFDAENNTL